MKTLQKRRGAPAGRKPATRLRKAREHLKAAHRELATVLNSPAAKKAPEMFREILADALFDVAVAAAYVGDAEEVLIDARTV